MASSEFFIDGTAFYNSEYLHTLFYDTLYGASAEAMGDVAWYDTLAIQTGPLILDAACRTGRVIKGLAQPGRQLFACDASPVLLQQAHARVGTLTDTCPVQVSQQRLDSFAHEERFDLILLPYYGFAHLLDAASRHACLQRIAQHLKPGGRAVIHLPSPQLLQRAVPAEEIELMRARYLLPETRAGNLVLEQRVQAIGYMEGYGLRWMQINALLLRESGEVLQQSPATLYYACITPEALQSAAAPAGLQLIETLSSFRDDDSGSGSELIAVLGHAGARQSAA